MTPSSLIRDRLPRPLSSLLQRPSSRGVILTFLGLLHLVAKLASEAIQAPGTFSAPFYPAAGVAVAAVVIAGRPMLPLVFALTVAGDLWRKLPTKGPTSVDTLL